MTENLDSYVIADEKVTYPDVPESKIKELKQVIAKKLGKEFPMEVLEKDYGMLDHSDKTCKYNPQKLEAADAYVHETYGMTEELMARDNFHYKAGDYTYRE